MQPSAASPLLTDSLLVSVEAVLRPCKGHDGVFYLVSDNLRHVLQTRGTCHCSHVRLYLSSGAVTEEKMMILLMLLMMNI